MSLESLIEATLAGLGYELVDMSMSVKSGHLRILIDKPTGISLDDCTLVSNHLSNWLVVEKIDYERLEISSPGTDRPLKKIADYQRFMGEKAQLKLRVALAGQRRFVGVICGVQNTQIELDVDGQVIELEIANIDSGRLVPDLK